PCGSTYCTWPYDSIPPLPVSTFFGEFQWLPKPPPEQLDWWEVDADSEDYDELYSVHNPASRRRLQDMAAKLAQEGLRVPDPFLKFMTTAGLVNSMRSVTGCFFMVPERPEPDPTGTGTRLPFYCDSQGVLLWDLYLHPSGKCCI